MMPTIMTSHDDLASITYVANMKSFRRHILVDCCRYVGPAGEVFWAWCGVWKQEKKAKEEEAEQQRMLNASGYPHHALILADEKENGVGPNQLLNSAEDEDTDLEEPKMRMPNSTEDEDTDSEEPKMMTPLQNSAEDEEEGACQPTSEESHHTPRSAAEDEEAVSEEQQRATPRRKTGKAKTCKFKLEVRFKVDDDDDHGEGQIQELGDAATNAGLARPRSIRRARSWNEAGDRRVNKEVERFLLDHGFESVNALRRNFHRYKYPLHSAVKHSNESMVRNLLELGANSSFKDSSGKTPLDLAEYLHRVSNCKLQSCSCDMKFIMISLR